MIQFKLIAMITSYSLATCLLGLAFFTPALDRRAFCSFLLCPRRGFITASYEIIEVIGTLQQSLAGHAVTTDRVRRVTRSDKIITGICL